MQPADFQSDRSGKLVKAPAGYWAFVPNPLPQQLNLDPSHILRLTEAERAIGRLAGVGVTLPNPYHLINPFIRREAVLSSRIEGTRASLSDLLFFEAAPSAPARPTDVREVANYVRALESALDPNRELPLSLRLIREMHRTLMTGVRGSHLTPGEFRRSQNWIGPPGSKLDDAIIVPPPVPEMHAALDALEKYLHQRSDLVPGHTPVEATGVLPSLGDILETGDGCEEPELVTGNGFPASRPFTIPGVVAVAHDDP